MWRRLQERRVLPKYFSRSGKSRRSKKPDAGASAAIRPPENKQHMAGCGPGLIGIMGDH
jgi:hypothetical protein